jgi:hypothetical protein
LGVGEEAMPLVGKVVRELRLLFSPWLVNERTVDEFCSGTFVMYCWLILKVAHLMR